MRDDVLMAIGELQHGPWRRVGNAFVPDVPYTVMCVALDVALDELHGAAPGFGARVAVGSARRFLRGRRICA